MSPVSLRRWRLDGSRLARGSAFGGGHTARRRRELDIGEIGEQAAAAVTVGTPDHATIGRSRKRSPARDLTAALFAEVARELDAMGLIVKRGALIGASLVEAQAARPALSKGAGAPSEVEPVLLRRRPRLQPAGPPPTHPRQPGP
jgi:hypothetical protein